LEKGEKTMVLNVLVAIVMAALLVESIYETLKMTWQAGKFNFDRLWALVIGVLVAVGGGLDLPKQVGIEMHIPYLGMILTGILISRGSNFMHDLLIKLQKPDPLKDLIGEPQPTNEIVPTEPENSIKPVETLTEEEPRAPGPGVTQQ
jgi:hypothetical protein